MVKYYCNRCGYTTNNRTYFLKHLNRKFTCKDTLESVTISFLKKKYNFTASVDENMVNKSKQKVNKSKQKVNKSKHNVTKYICQYCSKEYSCKQSLSRHINHYCKQNLINQLEDKNNKLEKENKLIKKEFELEKKKIEKEIEKILIINGSNNTINNTINNNTIIINNYGNENMDYISNDFLNKLLKTPYSAIPKLLKEIHFNKNHPENRTVRIRNKKLKYAEVHNNEKWEYRNKKEVIEDLVEKGYCILDDNYDEENGKIVPKVKQNYEKFKDNFDKKEVKDKIEATAELLIINNS